MPWWVAAAATAAAAAAPVAAAPAAAAPTAAALAAAAPAAAAAADERVDAAHVVAAATTALDGRVYGAQALGCCGRLTVEYTACDDGMVLVTIHDCDAHGSDPTSAARDANCQALHPVTQLYLQMAGMVASGSGSLKRTNEVVLVNEYNRKVSEARSLARAPGMYA